MASDENLVTRIGNLILAITEVVSEDEIYDLVVNTLTTIISGRYVSIYLPAEGYATLVAGYGEGEPHSVGAKIPLIGSVLEQCIALRAPIRWHADLNQSLSTDISANDTVSAHILIPIATSDEIFGLIVMGRDGAPFTYDDESALVRIAALCASCVERQRLLARIQRDIARQRRYNAHMHLLNEIGWKISSADTENVAFSLVADGAVQIVNAGRVTYTSIIPEKEQFIVAAMRGAAGEIQIPKGTALSIHNTAIGDTLKRGKVQHFTEIGDSDFVDLSKLSQSGIQQVWVVPVLGSGEPVGTLNIASSTAPIDELRHEQILLLESLGRLLGTTVERIFAQREAQTALSMLVDDSPLMQVVLSSKGIVRRVSCFGANSLGYQPEELIGKCFCTLFYNSEDICHRIKSWSEMDQKNVVTDELKMRRGDNDGYLWVRQSARAVINGKGESQLLVVCEDVTSMRELSAQLEHQARTDSLTGLPNRIQFEESLKNALFDTCDLNTAVMFVDLDRFKNVNDTHGHSSGDKVLCTMARRLSEVVRKTDIVARIGGDEFLLLLRGSNSAEELRQIAERVLDMARTPIRIAGNMAIIGCSVGIAISNAFSTGDDLIKYADIAMYHAKNQGRNNYQFYTDRLGNDLSERLKMEAALSAALKTRQLFLEFQPQFDSKTQEITGAEALLRWQHPEWGMVSPGRFVPVAEESGIITSLTDMVLDMALEAWNVLAKYKPDFVMSINVSACDFSEKENLCQRVEERLKKHNVPAGNLQLELTETALLTHPEYANKMMIDIANLGVSFAIDDFGTGYASLSYLVTLPITRLKIDRSFVSDLETNERKRSVNYGMVQLAKSLSATCIAEGVETAEQMEFLTQIGCDGIQGFYLARPMSLIRMRKLLREQSRQDIDEIDLKPGLNKKFKIVK